MPSFTSIIYFVIVIILSFLFGVKYSEPVKMYSSWIFEDGNQAELPKLSEDMLNRESGNYDYMDSQIDLGSEPSYPEESADIKEVQNEDPAGTIKTESGP